MYDYMLGGHHNFAADRELADRVIALQPDFPLIMRANRAFLRRAVAFLVSQGITQFLDIGSGIPTVGNVHEVAQSLLPTARVVYVDIDPVAVVHANSILEGNSYAIAIQADARRPEDILGHPEVRALLDFDKPMAVLLVAFLHFVLDEQVAQDIVERLRESVASGSYIVISHAVHTFSPETEREAVDLYNRTNATVRVRSSEEVVGFFKGLDVVEPGIVLAPLWRPEDPDDLFVHTPERSGMLAGIGRKP
jgi:hypothetical protein